MFVRIGMVILAGALMAACQTTYNNQTGTILNVIGGGLGNTEVFTPPYQTYNRRDGSYCEIYQVRQFNRGGRVRYGTATVCRYGVDPWFLAGQNFDPWIQAGSPVPAPSPSYPVPNPSHPVPNHPAPSQPMPPAPAPGQPGQWVPVTR